MKILWSILAFIVIIYILTNKQLNLENMIEFIKTKVERSFRNEKELSQFIEASNNPNLGVTMDMGEKVLQPSGFLAVREKIVPVQKSFRFASKFRM